MSRISGEATVSLLTYQELLPRIIIPYHAFFSTTRT
jgi:hypothetical protein